MSEQTALHDVADQMLINFFDKQAATNYITYLIEDNETGKEYLISMQLVGGETANQQLNQAKKDKILLQQRIDYLETMLKNTDLMRVAINNPFDLNLIHKENGDFWITEQKNGEIDFFKNKPTYTDVYRSFHYYKDVMEATLILNLDN